MSVVPTVSNEPSTVYYGSNIGLTDQPDLSNHTYLRTVVLTRNVLRSLHSELLPPNIQHLNLFCNYVGIHLPIVWPDTIETLNLEYNSISNTYAVEVWPSALRELSLDDNECTSIPENLPETLELLSIAGCKVNTLSNMPRLLKKLRAQYNLIKRIQQFPEQLMHIQLSYNLLQSSAIFRYKLPPTLQVLQLDSNHLTWLPSEFPDTLETLNLGNNTITEFTSKIPAKLKLLILNNNKLRIFQPTWGSSNQQLSLFIRNNCIIENLDYLKTRYRVESIYQGENWNKIIHGIHAKVIQFAYARYKLRKGIRSWARVAKIQEELLATAMHPDFVGRFDEVASWSMWNHK